MTTSQFVVELKNNEKVCKFCNVIQALSLVTFPIALPFFIIVMSSAY